MKNLKAFCFALLFLSYLKVVATVPSATISTLSPLNTIGAEGANIQVVFSGSLPLNCSIDGKHYLNINENSLQLVLNIDESKFYVIDSVWNGTGKSYKTDSIEVILQKRGPTVQNKTRLIGNGNDKVFSYFGTSDGGSIIAAEIRSNDKDFAYLNNFQGTLIRKYTPSQSIDWEVEFDQETGTKAIQASDGSILVVGTKFVNRGGIGSTDIWACKISSTGSVLWERLIGGTYFDYGFDCIESSSGGFLICGRSNSNDGDFFGQNGDLDGCVIKLRDNGTIEWTKLYGGSLREEYYSIKENSIGEIYVGGYSTSNDKDVPSNNGQNDLFLTKLNSSGNDIWHRSYGGNSFEQIKSIAITNGDSVLLGFDTNSTNFISNKTLSNISGALMKVDPLGNIQANSMYAFYPSSISSYLNKVLIDENQDLLVSIEKSQNSKNDIQLFKLKKDYSSIWNASRYQDWNVSFGDFDINNGKIYWATHFDSNNLITSYFNAQNIDLLEIDLCPTNDLSITGNFTISKFDSLDVPITATTITYPVNLSLLYGPTFTQILPINIPSAQESAYLAPTNDTEFLLYYGYDACTIIPPSEVRFTVTVQDCPMARTIATDETEDRLYKASNTIDFSSSTATNTQLEAGQSILLKPGFKTPATAVFEAKIKDCVE